jgi:ribosomal protein S27E
LKPSSRLHREVLKIMVVKIVLKTDFYEVKCKACLGKYVVRT